MDKAFWIKRWEEGRIRWHQDKVLPLLAKHWPSLRVPTDAHVLVPLCGKSLDMTWLAQQGLRVLGAEIAPLAVEQFFAENGLEPEKHETADGFLYSAGGVEIILGDLFQVSAGTLAQCDAIYDRAALIAQPPDERRYYADAVYGRLPVRCRGLLITLEYPQAEMNGPPFSVDEAEVDRLFAADWEITLAERRDILARMPQFQAAGLTSLHTTVYRLRRR
jgi:thiopurine S-methyltransferase